MVLCLLLLLLLIHATIKSSEFFFLAEGFANGFLNDEMILQGSDGTIASVNYSGLKVDNTF